MPNNSIIRYPIRFAGESWVLRVTADSVTENLTFSTVLGTDYYMAEDGSGVALLTMLHDCLETHSELSGDIVVELDEDFKVKITGVGTIDILWTHGSTTLDKAIFGFTGDTSISTDSETAPRMPRGIWRPGRFASKDTRPRQPLVSSVATAISGVTRTAVLAVPKKPRDFSFEWLPKDVALDEYAETSAPYNTFERAWLDGIGYGRVFRLYENEGSSTYSNLKIATPDDPLVQRDRVNFWDANIKAVVQ